MVRALSAAELGRLIDDLQKPTSLVELAVIGACLLGAWVLVRLLRGAGAKPGSVWFGEGVVGGVLFPVVTLLFALAGRWALTGVVPLAVFRLVIPILVSLLAIRLTVRVLHYAFPHSKVMRVVERSVSWLAWIAVVLWITGVLPLVMDQLDDVQIKIGAAHVSVSNLIQGSLSAIVVLVIALWISSALEHQLLDGKTDNLSIRKMAANSLRALLLLVGLALALSAAGIDLTAFGVLGGALGVGIGFGLQKLASNYVSGFVILAERSLRIGDMVKVDGFEGRITDITTRYTVVRALNGRESIVPNEMMITQRVENASFTDPKVVVTTTLQVAYGTDLAALRPLLMQAIVTVPRVLAEPGPGFMLTGFGANGLDLTIVFWIQDPENGPGGVQSDVNLVILRVLEEQGVEIPYPQVVVRAPPARPDPGAG